MKKIWTKAIPAFCVFPSDSITLSNHAMKEELKTIRLLKRKECSKTENILEMRSKKIYLR
jgi:hypothetical protein